MKLSTTKAVMMQDLNPYGTLFGGVLMGWMDELAMMLAIRYTKRNCVTAKFSEIHFKEPVHLKDMVDVTAELSKVGHSSLTIDLKAHKLCFQCTEPLLVAHATAVFVALDDQGKPSKVDE